MEKIRVIIADDHRMFRDGLKASFNTSDKIQVVGEASDGWELLDKLKSIKADVLIVDINMPGIDGIETSKLIKDIFPNSKILLLTMHDSKEYLMEALSVGVYGYVLKMAKIEKLFHAVEQVAKSEIYFDPEIAKSLPPLNSQNKYLEIEKYLIREFQLTEREMAIAKLLVSGYSAFEIAETLNISYNTVNNHRHNIFQKLHISNLAELIKLVIRGGITNQ